MKKIIKLQLKALKNLPWLMRVVIVLGLTLAVFLAWAMYASIVTEADSAFYASDSMRNNNGDTEHIEGKSDALDVCYGTSAWNDELSDGDLDHFHTINSTNFPEYDHENSIRGIIFFSLVFLFTIIHTRRRD